jgi:hypothetical protein
VSCRLCCGKRILSNLVEIQMLIIVSGWRLTEVRLYHSSLIQPTLIYEHLGLRIAEKRSLPCPNRLEWFAARDTLYENIMTQAWNAENKHFGQSFEENDVLDSAVLIMPLVFFMQASDPRFMSTLERIMKSPERGGLTSNVSKN